MIICIPTRGREDSKLQTTVKNLPNSYLDKVYFFTEPRSVNDLAKVIPNQCKVIPVPEHLEDMGISGKRQYIVDWAYANEFYKIWQVDDSLRFCENTGIHPSLGKGPQLLGFKNNDDLIPHIVDMENKLDEYAMVGHLNRSGTYQQRLKTETVFDDIENARMYSSFGLNVKLFVENNIRFDMLQKVNNDNSLSLMEDYSVILQLLTKGFNILQLGSWCFDKRSFSGKGGCTSERSSERQTNVCKALAKQYPDYVTVTDVKDENKKEVVKNNVKISWKKIKDSRIPTPPKNTLF
jgi:hypothetical protein